MRFPTWVAVVVAVVGAGAAGCGGSGSSAAVKANGCTAVVRGTMSGRDVVTYADKTTVPAMHQAISAAVSAWNGAPTHVVLQPATGTPSITIVSPNAATETTPCNGHGARTPTITLDSAKWTAGNTVAHPVRDVSIEIGHALGLSRAGSCSAVMHKKHCSSEPTAPNAAEVKEINKLYPAPTSGQH